MATHLGTDSRTWKPFAGNNDDTREGSVPPVTPACDVSGKGHMRRVWDQAIRTRSPLGGGGGVMVAWVLSFAVCG